ncbi:hypothetical protein [Bacillus solimangrovi]|uniref:LXG domain-containing protein n=1 Tax=Bacillus solimangrovi TaxID=1305675 RepID=A0A1E5LD38_9BACI|nr:hypothetical protein [Bacillus solimangrovi]OEH92007.1 hypothetical protein BFG57_17230 [Bacillus solimangrovi]
MNYVLVNFEQLSMETLEAMDDGNLSKANDLLIVMEHASKVIIEKINDHRLNRVSMFQSMKVYKYRKALR